jgi:hypothetical protein
MSIARQIGAALSTKAVTAHLQRSPQHTDELLSIADAARRLGRTPWTLKRMHQAGNLPAVIMNGLWFVPASFVIMVLRSPRPGHAGVIEEIAREWFAAHTPGAVTT